LKKAPPEQSGGAFHLACNSNVVAGRLSGFGHGTGDSGPFYFSVSIRSALQLTIKLAWERIVRTIVTPPIISKAV
jgi:hypothetical protein